MHIDKEIIDEYLFKGNINSYKDHWLFHCIEDDQYIFEEPALQYQQEVAEILNTLCAEVEAFHPFNRDIFLSLFPNWSELTDNLVIVPVVGCPNPYDAMVREKDGKEYVFFDLIRFTSYVKDGVDAIKIVRQLLTHEIIHICIHADYQPPKEDNYRSSLYYTVFDEGFAHLLAFQEDIYSYDFTKALDKFYETSRSTLLNALQEEDPKAQKEYLLTSNAGPYWEKFAAISGKLYLANHIAELEKIYREGFDSLVGRILN